MRLDDGVNVHKTSEPASLEFRIFVIGILKR